MMAFRNPAISGGGGIGKLVSSQTITSAGMNIIDTGPNILPPTNYTAQVVFSGQISGVGDALGGIIFNGDTAAHYDWLYFNNQPGAGVPTYNQETAQNNIICILRGSSTDPNYSCLIDLRLQAYANTVFYKDCWAMSTAIAANGTNSFTTMIGGGWRSKVAINQVAISSLTNTFSIGSQMNVYVF